VAAAVEHHEQRSSATVLGTPVRHSSFIFQSPSRGDTPVELSVDLWGAGGGKESSRSGGGPGSSRAPPSARPHTPCTVQQQSSEVRCSRVFVLYLARVIVQRTAAFPPLPCRLLLPLGIAVEFVFDISALVASFMPLVRRRLRRRPSPCTHPHRKSQAVSARSCHSA